MYKFFQMPPLSLTGRTNHSETFWSKKDPTKPRKLANSRFSNIQVFSSKLWSSQLWKQIKQLRIEAWKSQDFNGVWTHALAIPVQRSNQLNYEVTDVRSWSFVGSIRNCLICVHNCHDHSLLDFKSAVQYMKYIQAFSHGCILERPLQLSDRRLFSLEHYFLRILKNKYIFLAVIRVTILQPAINWTFY